MQVGPVVVVSFLHVAALEHHDVAAVQAGDILDLHAHSGVDIAQSEVLCRTRLLLSDLYHLNVGDVVDIKQPKDSPIFLNIDGRRWFDGGT